METRDHRPCAAAHGAVGTWRDERGVVPQFRLSPMTTRKLSRRGSTVGRPRHDILAASKTRRSGCWRNAFALMEGAEACRTQATGMAAMTTAHCCANCRRAIMSSRQRRRSGRAGGWSIICLPKFGIATTVIDAFDTDAEWEAMQSARIRRFSSLKPPPIRRSDIVDMAVCLRPGAKSHGITTVVDNAFASRRVAAPYRIWRGRRCLFRDQIDGRTRARDGRRGVRDGGVYQRHRCCHSNATPAPIWRRSTHG